MGPLNVYVAGQDSEVEICLYDLQGRMLTRAKHEMDAMRMVSLDLSHLVAGSYILEATGRTVQQQVKLMKL
jgi:hypothetical protein